MNDKHQPTQPGNPRQLTINQHVMPRSSIARFTNDGEVSVVSLPYGTVKKRHPEHGIFCVKRLWDQKAETTGSRKIEDAYQHITDAVVNGRRTFTDEQQEAITEMFFWCLTRPPSAFPSPLNCGFPFSEIVPGKVIHFVWLLAPLFLLPEQGPQGFHPAFGWVFFGLHH